MGWLREEKEEDQKIVLILHFDSGVTSVSDVDGNFTDVGAAAKSFVESGMLKNTHFFVNGKIILTHKIEFIEFKKVSRRPEPLQFGV